MDMSQFGVDSTPKPKPLIIIVHETIWESLINDAVSFITLFGLIGIGVWLHSDVLQFVGAVMAMVWLVSRANSKAKRLTVAEARARLDEIEKDSA